MSLIQGVQLVLLFAVLYFEVFLLVGFIARVRHPEARRTTPRVHPRVAIVVPCFNEEGTVASTIRSLLALAYPANKLEILVVDDGSSDRTYDIASSFTNNEQVRVFRKENGGKHSALNFALAHTEADFIGCLDADSEVAPDALNFIIDAFNDDPRIAAVTPGIHTKDPSHTLLQHIQKAEYRLGIFMRYAFASLGSVFITPGPFSIFRADIVRKLGGWRHAHSTEDLEIGLRLQRFHHIIRNEPRAIVYTVTPRTLRGLVRQRVRWSYGFLRNTVDYRFMVGNRAYGNLGLIVLPAALLSIIIALYFAFAALWYGLWELLQFAANMQAANGFVLPGFDLFYINTTVWWLVTFAAIALALGFIFIGGRLSAARGMPLFGTPLFIVLYGILVPLWLSVAVVRAILGSGVRWR